jgi:xanthine dehydrogenase accessory factor
VDILTEIPAALELEDRIMMATIIATDGSTPAAALSKMLVTGQGTRLVGTVGGGCIESDVVFAAKELYGTNQARVLTFHLDEDHPESGMLCGGKMDVLIEPVTNAIIPFVEQMITIRDEGRDCIVATALSDQFVVLKKSVFGFSTNGLMETEEELSGLQRMFPAISAEMLQKIAHRQESVWLKGPAGEVVLEAWAGTPSLILFGGGHVSRYVSRCATLAGFSVTVVDDRKEYANPQRFPEAAATLAVEFTSALEYVKVTPSTYLVIVTRGHRSDEDVLRGAIKTKAKYIGMIGSKKKVTATYRHLLEEGVAVEQLSAIRAPIGLDIGAVTAEEIAVSIVAELIQVRRGHGSIASAKSADMKNIIAELKKVGSHG